MSSSKNARLGGSMLPSEEQTPPLGALSVETFLQDYWQQRPALIRQGLPNFTPPISADELAGLSLEDDVESRIIQEVGPKEAWEIWQGPMSEALFRRLPSDQPWTLLVQAVDQWVPEVAALRDRFQFLPSWRLDDIMISYANKGGSVGPHYDHYDVFLIQAQGEREWHIGQTCTEEDALLDNAKVRILEQFETQTQHHLKPGDILYLPPKVAHYGPALTDDCMTISIGFRAPSHLEMFQGFTDYLADEISDFERYSDAGLERPSHPAEIDAASLERVKKAFEHYIHHPQYLKDWFGRLMTERKYPDLEPPMEGIVRLETLVEDLEGVQYLRLDEASRLAFSQDSVTSSEFQAYIDGESYTLPQNLKPIVEALSRERNLCVDTLIPQLEDQDMRELLVDWINRQKLFLQGK